MQVEAFPWKDVRLLYGQIKTIPRVLSMFEVNFSSLFCERLLLRK